MKTKFESKLVNAIAHTNVSRILTFARKTFAVTLTLTVLSTAGEVVNTMPRITVQASTEVAPTIPVGRVTPITDSANHVTDWKTEIENASLNSTTDSIYPATYKVYKLDYDKDLVYIISSTGYVYTFYGCEDYMMDDYVTCIMGDNSTTEITDDYIIDVRYSGFWDDRTITEN